MVDVTLVKLVICFVKEMIILVHTILDRSGNKPVRLQYYCKLDKNIPHTAHHWGILLTSLTLTQGIKITLSLEERYIILQFDFDFTNSPLSPPLPPRNHKSFLTKGTKLCSPARFFFSLSKSHAGKESLFIQFLSGTGSQIYHRALLTKRAIKMAPEKAAYWPGFFW